MNQVHEVFGWAPSQAMDMWPVERITANGGQILNGPMEVPGGDWVLNGMDPQGAAFSLHARVS